jgi:hypothetical protein
VLDQWHIDAPQRHRWTNILSLQISSAETRFDFSQKLRIGRFVDFSGLSGMEHFNHINHAILVGIEIG